MNGHTVHILGEKDDTASSSCRQFLLESPTSLLLNWLSLLLSNLSSPMPSSPLHGLLPSVDLWPFWLALGSPRPWL